MKTRMTSLNKMAGCARYMLAAQVEELITAAEHTSEVKRYTKEEIAAYEARLNRK